MPLKFNHFIAIDWSGAEKPVQNLAIALAYYTNTNDIPCAVQTKLSRQHVFDYLSQQIKSPHITLVGIDANLGYAQAMCQHMFGSDITAQNLWANIDALCATTPNFFTGPVWINQKFTHLYWQKGTEPSHWLPKEHRRLTETICGQQGLGHPENPFKLMGTKQVGKGGLAAMRLLHQLKTAFGPQLCVWPFEQPTPHTRMVLTEIYPRLFLKHAGFGNKKIRDITTLQQALQHFKARYAPQSTSTTDHMADAMVSAAALRLWGNEGHYWPKLPPITQLEGWIFGVNTENN